jgi:hypothetical protein
MLHRARTAFDVIGWRVTGRSETAAEATCHDATKAHAADEK